MEAFLLQLAHVDADRPALLAASSHLPGHDLVREATEHGVLALLAEAAQREPTAWPALTAATAEPWSGHLAWTMRLLVDLQELTTALGHLPYAVLKGPVLGGPLYGDPFLRASSDLDLLVRREHRAEAAAALSLKDLSTSFADADVADGGQTSALLPRGTPVDLHWELVNDPAARRQTGLATSTVLGRTRVVDVRGVPTVTLDAEDTVLHLTSHALVSGGHRLVWYVDLDRALRDPALDPEELRRRAEQSGLATGLAVLQRRCAHHLGTPTVVLRASRAWGLLGRTVTAPPSGAASRRSRGQLYYRATRQSSVSSLRALADVSREATGHPRPKVRSVALISLEPWDTMWRRNQHLVHELVGQGLLDRVVFVEPPRPGRGRSSWAPEPGVAVLRPSLFVPKRVGGQRLTGWWLRLTALRGIDLVWVNNPDLGVHCLPALRPAIYDVTDDWRTFTQAPRVLRRLVAAEDELAARARTIVCSQVLADRWRERYSVEAAVLHNGIDVAAFTAAVPRPLPGEPPHIGYVGTLHDERLDLPLVLDLARLPGTVHLVGPSSLSGADADRLSSGGVVLHGPVPSGDVASWMASMDVLVSPHLVTDFTLSLDAIKSYEYLATGQPVVATPSSGFQLLDAPALIVASRDAYCDAVQEAVDRGPFEPLRDSGWDRRAQRMAQLLRAGPGLGG